MPDVSGATSASNPNFTKTFIEPFNNYETPLTCKRNREKDQCDNQPYYDPIKLNTFPPEILQLIFDQIDSYSPQYTINLANIIEALNCERTTYLYPNLINDLKNKFFLLNLTKLSKEELLSKELIKLLFNDSNNNFNVETDPQKSFILERNELKLSSNLQEENGTKKILYIIDDSILSKEGEDTQTNNNKIPLFQKPIDLIYLPKNQINFDSKNDSIIPILQSLPLGISVNNLIFDFASSSSSSSTSQNHHDMTVYAGKKLFGLLDFEFFSFRQNNLNDRYPEFFMSNSSTQNSWLHPRINQISFPFIETLLMDYMTIDTFIYNILTNLSEMFPYTTTNSDNNQFLSPSLYSTHSNASSNHDYYFQEHDNIDSQDHNHHNRNHNESCIQSIFKEFLKNVKFYFPDLKSLKFIQKKKSYITNGNYEETCNFIDLSTLMLQKFKSNNIPLIYLFQLHSLKNWYIPKIKHFTGHRFKFNETTMTGSPERYNSKLIENLDFLHSMIATETNDATPYFRINLIPEGVIRTKILNWIPLSINDSYHLNSYGKEPNTTTTTNSTTENNNNDNYRDTFQNKTLSVNSHDDLNNNNETISFSNNNKPFFCLKSKSLQVLELKFLNGLTNLKIINIQGLYLSNLQKIILNNDKFKLSKPIISDKRNSIIMINSMEANNEFIPIEFSNWNDLTSCTELNFTSSSSSLNKVNQNSNTKSNLIFCIKNLKENLPNLKFRESFENFFDERQKFIVV
ncbi:Bop2p NDAI_0I02420 [Naumovozyma dairenensis CBS 421]|uniref:Uncharacterized protein n=1 Tax=Naumovozyma dairenensis (strain ATCC 10597 / BCRC 20456 / CBS 421 / NBRC 0211 / NRRL Y-12639) TaxID=1071378 RepID=G0WG99_NAUDC|nr:hypothetical protein NDAI_0I02420 [Naumovozyma dairenensis CBS 421]CCD26810.1 hypothetical protein NDAI_0I02420 [Naumovozyma dairenensis CBS 421]